MVKVTTAIVPQAEIERLKKESSPIIKKAEALIIKTAQGETEAYEILKQIKDRIKLIEGKRKAITQPLNQSLKAANALFKTLAEPVKEADGIIRDKILQFREKREEQAEEKQERLIERGREEEAAEVVPRVGKSKTQIRWTIRIIDARKLPEKLLRKLLQTEEGHEIMEKYLRKQLRDAPRDEEDKPLMEISGCEVYQEESVRVM